MSIELITILMFGSMLLLLLMGLPVAFSCGTVGIIFTVILQGPSAVNIVPTRIFGLMVNYLLDAIPRFIFMACILERGGLIAEIYEMVHQWLGWLNWEDACWCRHCARSRHCTRSRSPQRGPPTRTRSTSQRPGSTGGCPPWPLRARCAHTTRFLWRRRVLTKS